MTGCLGTAFCFRCQNWTILSRPGDGGWSVCSFSWCSLVVSPGVFLSSLTWHSPCNTGHHCNRSSSDLAFTSVSTDPITHGQLRGCQLTPGIRMCLHMWQLTSLLTMQITMCILSVHKEQIMLFLTSNCYDGCVVCQHVCVCVKGRERARETAKWWAATDITFYPFWRSKSKINMWRSVLILWWWPQINQYMWNTEKSRNTLGSLRL